MISLLKNKKTLLLMVLILGTLVLRFVYLGYSDFDNSEITVMDFVKNYPKNFTTDYFLQRRKGPLQWLVSLIPYYMGADVYNETLYRIPYAIVSVLSVYVFFKVVHKITKDFWVALISAALFSFNGFHVIFGRVVQYQSLNLLFSYLSIYLILLAKESKGFRKNLLILLSSASLVTSFTAHWDAIFVLPVLIYLMWEDKEKIKGGLIWAVPLLIAGIFLLLPYLTSYISNIDNQSYFSQRVGITGMNYDDFFFRTKLFNPFLFTCVFFATSVLGLFVRKKAKIFYLQFIFAFLYFAVIGRSPGSHVYNFYIPLYVIFSMLLKHLIDKFPKYSLLTGSVVAVYLAFIFLQSYVLMVGHKKEYPFEQEKVLLFETPEYTHEILTRHIFGFTHNREWVKIAKYLNEQDPNLEVKYVTNESYDVADYYLNRDSGTSDEYFAIGIKRPLNFVNDYSMRNHKDKERLTKIATDEGITTAVIYMATE